MIVVYQKMTREEIQKAADETLPRLEQWFADNPKRRVCNCKGFYGGMAKIRRGHVRVDFQAVVDAAIKDAAPSRDMTPHEAEKVAG